MNWTDIPVGSSVVRAIHGVGGAILAGSDGGIKRSVDSGLTWTTVWNTSGLIANAFYTTSGGVTYFGGSVVMKSTNGGLNRALANGGIPGIVYSFNGTGNGVLAALPASGVYVTLNGGVNWSAANTGLNSIEARGFVIKGLYSYVVIGCMQGSGGVWKRLVNELIGIKQISSEVPKEYSLSQNYPNPFNPNTVIRFSLSVAGMTNLKVYDILGREVATLVNEQLKSGTYEVDFDGTNFASGIYYYNLITGDYSETRKMVLLK